MKHFLAILLLACVPLLAQQDVQRTIEQCKRDLGTDATPEKRRGAVLVLGKYDTPEVTLLLGRCLEDPDVEVRRSALVALIEQPQRLRTNAAAVMGLLEDPDLHIRRLASSSLSACMGVYISGNVRMSPGSRITAGGSRARPDSAALFSRALGDEDPEVRRNVLEAAQYLGEPLYSEALLPLLEDPSPQVVALAIPLYAQSIGNPEEKSAALKPFVRHQNSQLRLILAAVLPALPNALPMLLELSEDDNPEVRAQALLGRARRRASSDTGLASALLGELTRDGASSSEVERLLDALVVVDEEKAWEFLVSVISGDDMHVLQECAWQQVLQHPEWHVRISMPVLAEAISRFAGNRRLRNQMFSVLRKHASELTVQDLAVLQGSPLPASRSVPLELFRDLPAPLQEEVLAESLLDEDDGIRLKALDLLGSARPVGWQDLLIATLEDPDPAMQTAAAEGLVREIRRNPAVKSALAAWLPKCSDPKLRGRIEAQLK